MKNLKLVALGAIVLVQSSLISAMSEQGSVKIKSLESRSPGSKMVQKQIIESTNMADSLIDLVRCYAEISKEDIAKKSDKIFDAIKSWDVKNLDTAIKMGGDVNFENIFEQTPLSFAFQELPYLFSIDSYKCIELLINNGANVNFQNCKGESILMLLVEKSLFSSLITVSKINIVDLLVKNKANLDMQDELGETVLMKAVKVADFELIKTLLNRYSININTKDKTGKTAIDHANQRAVNCSDDGYSKKNFEAISLCLSSNKHDNLVQHEMIKDGINFMESRTEEESKEDAEFDLAIQNSLEDLNTKNNNEKELLAKQIEEERQRIIEFHENRLHEVRLQEQREQEVRRQREQEALAQALDQPSEEENWQDEQEQQEVAEDWGELEQED